MRTFGPSAHALFVTVGHSRPGAGVTGWPVDQRLPEKRKVGSSTLPLTTTSWVISQPSHLRRQQEERDSHGAGSAHH
jgi:hypothetical protein